MGLSKFDKFRKKIERSLNQMGTKISSLHDGVKGLATSHREFQAEMTDFMSFMAEELSDYERRISSIEKKLK